MIPSNGLLRMCSWMGSHCHDWADCHGVAFSGQLYRPILVTFERYSLFLVNFLGKKFRSYRPDRIDPILVTFKKIICPKHLYPGLNAIVKFTKVMFFREGLGKILLRILQILLF